ncbi:MAG TPA: dihydrodipicolinate synthase family protein [Tepidisphaeraceae bacterium]|nr:dihydrodipicolinate synthase family protein [Tepidisphaeraceae bacterium]
MLKPLFYAAIGTPLTSDESLHREGLEAHLHDQWRAGISGVLVGGTMGLMQLLTDQTYRDLVDQAAEFTGSRGQLMVGAGDTSLARTLARIRWLNGKKLDGVVVLPPYLVRFTQAELVAYYTALADASKNPLYLYDLPVLTGTKLELESVLTLARHRNIRGIKCSCDLGWSRQLADLAPEGFEVIFAQADLVDVLLRQGLHRHLDGIFSLAPRWTVGIGAAAEARNWEQAEALQQKLSALLRVIKRYGVFPSFTALLNARGIRGNFAPAPFRPLEPHRLAALMAEPIVQQLLQENRLSVAADETAAPASLSAALRR